MPRIRCMWYDANGTPKENGCRRSNCDFIHPSEPGWDSAPSSRQGVRSCGHGHASGPGHSTGSSQRAPNGPRADRRRNADDTRGWNQREAAETGAPVDRGWGSAKRKNSGWGASDASSANSGWGASNTGGDVSSAWSSGDNAGWGSTVNDADASSSSKVTVKSSGWGGGWGAPDASSSVSKPSDVGWGKTTWGEPGWNNNQNSSEGWGQPTVDSTKKEIPARPSDAVDSNQDGSNGKSNAFGSSSNTDQAWGNSAWGAITSDNGGWGTVESSSSRGWATANNNAGSGGNSVDINATTPTSQAENINSNLGSWGASSTAEFVQPARKQPPQAPRAERITIKLPATIPKGDSSGWGATPATPTPERNSREPGEVVESPGKVVDSGWDNAPVPQEDVALEDSAAFEREDTPPAVLPFGAPTASFIDDTDWPMHPISDTLSEKVHARKPSGTSLASNSRPTSPCDSLVMGKKPSPKDYVRALTRAIQCFEELNEAKEHLAKTKRMELSHSYEKIGDRGAEILRKSHKDAEHKQRSTKRRLDEAIERLDKFSPVARQPSSSATEEEIANLRTYVEDVSAWIENIRPTAELMRSKGLPQDKNEDETPSDDRRIGHPPSSMQSSGILDPDLVVSLFEKLAILEERVSSVEGDRDDLERGQKAFIQQTIDEKIPLGTFATGNGSNLQARIDNMQTLTALSRLAGDLKADGGELGSEVKSLRLSNSLLEQQKMLHAENAELKQRLSKVETEIDNQRHEILTAAEDIRRLREALTVTQPPPTAETRPEQISEILAPFLLDSIRSDVMGAFTAMKQNMAQTVTKSQEDVCKNLWDHLEPILKMAHAVHETAEKACRLSSSDYTVVPVLSVPELD